MENQTDIQTCSGRVMGWQDGNGEDEERQRGEVGESGSWGLSGLLSFDWDRSSF